MSERLTVLQGDCLERMRYGSVCSGVEAASLAWQPLGWEPAWFSEIDPFACAVLAHHYPDVPNLGDLTRWREWNLEPGSVDVLVGGTPCQSFSVAGLRKGMDDPRGNLVLDYLALAEHLRPTWLVWENVAGVLSQDGGRAFGAILGALAELGYGFAYRVLDAQYFGVPQRRRRVFVVGHLGDWRRAAAVLLERHSLQGHPAPSREAGKGVAGTLSTRASACGGLGTDFELGGQEVAATLRSGGSTPGSHGKKSGTDTETFVVAPLTTDPSADNASQESQLVAQPLLSGGHSNNPMDQPLVAHAVTADVQRLDGAAETLVTHALRADGFDASEDGTGRGTPPVPVAFAQNQRNEVREMGQVGALGAIRLGDAKNETLIAFGCKQDAQDAQDDQSPTLRAMGHDGSHANGGGQVAVAFQTRVARNGRGGAAEVVPALTNRAGDSGKGDSAPCVAFQSSQSGVREVDAHATLDSNNGSRRHNGVLSDWQVRRLTPTECERLMGMPDGYTDVPYRGKPAADGPRYRALGNSIVVPVLRWIGRRIASVVAIG